MVRKLFRHECVALGRVLLPAYGALLGIAVFIRILRFIQWDHIVYNIVLGSAIALWVMAGIVCLFMATAMGVIRYYRNLFTSEGYLTFTLPVSPAQHIAIKLLSTLVFEALATATILSSGLIIASGDLFTEVMKAASYLIGLIPSNITPHLALYIVEFVLLCIVTGISNLLIYYSCITIGQLARKNRILLAVGVYFIYSTAVQVLTTILTIISSLLSFSVMEAISEWVAAHPLLFVHLLFCGSLFFALALSATLFFVCHRIITRRLNLE